MWVWRSSRWEACAFLLQVCWSVRAAHEIQRPFWRNVLRLCVRLLLRALNLLIYSFLACHHCITDFEINAFLNQDSYRLLKFVSDLVSIFDTGWSGLVSIFDTGFCHWYDIVCLQTCLFGQACASTHKHTHAPTHTLTRLFLLGLFWGLPLSHRLSSHSRLNAFVIQTKLNLTRQTPWNGPATLMVESSSEEKPSTFLSERSSSV